MSNKEQIMQNNDSKKILTLIVLIATLMVCTTGATYAYFAFTATNSTTVTGTAAAGGLTLTITQQTLGGTSSGTNTNVMVPQKESALSNAMGNSYKCVDTNGNIVCKVFKIDVSTTSTATIPTTGTITFNPTTANLKWKLVTNATTLGSGTTNAASGSATTFATPTFTASTKSFTYYMLIWINETNAVQSDSGTWKATITFNNANGGITSTITS